MILRRITLLSASRNLITTKWLLKPLSWFKTGQNLLPPIPIWPVLRKTALFRPAFVAPIELATGKSAYFVGKPNPLMMRTGLRLLGVHSDEAAMIGDRMDTDIVAGMESGLETVLVLSGVTTRENMQVFAYRPRHILNGVGDIVPKEWKEPFTGSFTIP